MIDQGARARVEESTARPQARYRVVVAEADPQLVALLDDQVTALGHAVVGVARQWSVALDLTAARRPDLLILNLEMPDADLGRLRALVVADPALRVIGMAYAGCPVVDAAREAGMHQYLPRSFGLPALAQAIEQALASRQGHGMTLS